MFTQLPIAMTKLDDAVRQMDDVAIQTPPPMVEIGKRLRLAFESSRLTAYSGLSQSELRKLPYAYWLSDEPCLTKTERELVRRYWTVNLPEALASSHRRAKRWLTPLFFTYCEHFDPSKQEFRDFALRIVQAIQSAQGQFAEKLRELQRTYNFFSPTEGPSRLAATFFLDHEKTIANQMEEMLLWPSFFVSSLGHAVFKAGLTFPGERYRFLPIVLRLLDWNKQLPAAVVKTDLRVLFADALLKHWGSVKPADSIKGVLIEFFVRVYGDPRFENHRQFQWKGVSPQALGTLLNWMTGDTLRAFINLLKHTADDIWMYRQKFWMAYYEKGHIDEAWLALGQDALFAVKRFTADTKGMGYGRLEGGAANNQSVMFLRIGDIVFTEWSHNGSLRAFRHGFDQAPVMYQRSYHGTDLRSAVSMDFHGGMNMNPGLVHSHSDKGTWQRKARDFIRIHTGVKMNDREII